MKSYGDYVPSYSMTKKWVAEFKHGRESLEDANRCGCSVSLGTQENVTKVLDMVMADRRVTTLHIASTRGISHTKVNSNLTKDMEMKKILVQWVPRLFTPEQ